jgi:hypothetical protein
LEPYGCPAWNPPWLIFPTEQFCGCPPGLPGRTVMSGQLKGPADNPSHLLDWKCISYDNVKSRRFTRRIFSASRYISGPGLKAVGPVRLQTRLQVGRSALILSTDRADLRA